MEFKVLYIDATKRSYKIESVNNPELFGIVDLGLQVHLDMKSYNVDPLDPANPLVLGIGPFAGGAVVGSHRIVAVFKSPESRGLHVSEMGGAGYSFFRTGLDALVITGRSERPLLIRVIGSSNGEVSVSFSDLSFDELNKIYSNYAGLSGTKALTKYVVDMDRDLIVKNHARVAVVGPGAYKTPFAGIFSYVLDDKGNLTEVSDSASRGGGGSVMAQAHNVVAITFGGTYKRPNPNLSNVQILNKIAQEVYKKPFSQALLDKTTKYRFDPASKTGGTFGENYPHYKELVPMLNYNHVYLSRGLRLELHGKIMDYFWRPFQDEVFDGGKLTPASKNCGEPCPVVCKKIFNKVKIDYEPAHGVGPISGIFDIKKSAELVDLVDNLGLDAIEAGHFVGWIFDLIDKGLLNPEDVGLDRKPVMDPKLQGPEASKVNAELARKLLINLVSDDTTKVLKIVGSMGLRAAAKELDNLYSDRVAKSGVKFEDLLVYAAFGKSGYFTPNFYWSPGVLAPLFVLGKYWTDYSPAFREPEDYASAALRRAVMELLIANAGFCRFHRGWAEEALTGLYKEMLGAELDVYKHGLLTYKRIAEYQAKSEATPEPWESRKVMDAIASLAAETGVHGWEDAMYHTEKMAEWWNRFYKKLQEELNKVS
ncbi:aldehyde ferredoxin oxidoreductase N-terminal domain-containing protein [Acidilobus sp.]|jgi:glyceraldehyde-3-phosphate dehydrogenase (ferredoxin)|uniref:aldehyde ferredoxin oxidoreductase N-terminal domain-containing protein n=1 Tax=Acidilobus sp. TaxID=1872109 RepID=UPI003D0084FF